MVSLPALVTHKPPNPGRARPRDFPEFNGSDINLLSPQSLKTWAYPIQKEGSICNLDHMTALRVRLHKTTCATVRKCHQNNPFRILGGLARKNNFNESCMRQCGVAPRRLQTQQNERAVPMKLSLAVLAYDKYQMLAHKLLELWDACDMLMKKWGGEGYGLVSLWFYGSAQLTYAEMQLSVSFSVSSIVLRLQWSPEPIQILSEIHMNRFIITPID